MTAEKFGKGYHERHGKLPRLNDVDYIRESTLDTIISKFHIMATPIMSPGRCANCGASVPDGRRYVDFGLTIEGYGVVYICTLCLIEVYKLIEPIKRPSEGFQQKKNNAQLSRQLNVIQEKVGSLVDELHHINLMLAGSSASNEQPVPDMDTTKSKDESGPTPDESGTSEPVTESGRSDIPTLTELTRTRKKS